MADGAQPRDPSWWKDSENEEQHPYAEPEVVTTGPLGESIIRNKGFTGGPSIEKRARLMGDEHHTESSYWRDEHTLYFWADGVVTWKPNRPSSCEHRGQRPTPNVSAETLAEVEEIGRTMYAAAWKMGYEHGESSMQADYVFAFDDLLPPQVDASKPTELAKFVRELIERN